MSADKSLENEYISGLSQNLTIKGGGRSIGIKVYYVFNLYLLGKKPEFWKQNYTLFNINKILRNDVI